LRASTVSGAAFWAGRLYLAYQRGSYLQVLSYPVDSVTGDVGTACADADDHSRGRSLAGIVSTGKLE
ncbi:MAG: hypothetical protein ACXWN1_31570, partial [Thermoanaerobaculia bacterium]